MIFLTVIVGILIERFLGSMEELRGCHWFQSYTQWVRNGPLSGERWNSTLGLVVVLAGPLALLLFALSMIDEWWLLHFGFSVLVLLFSFGPRDLEAEVEALLDAWERKDEESANWYISDLLGQKEIPKGEELSRHLVETILVQANIRFLAVIFWFVILGPLGAVLFRLSTVLKQQTSEEETPFAAAASRLATIITLPPAYLSAFTFGLAGNLMDTMSALRASLKHEDGIPDAVVVESGRGAMCFEQKMEEAAKSDNPAMTMVSETVSLIRRSVMVALAIIALLTLAGWSA